MQIKYLLGAVLAFPFLPLLYFQGKHIRTNIPRLPEAKGPRGESGLEFNQIVRVMFIGESTIAGVGVETHEEGFAGSFALEFSDRIEKQISWQVYAKSGYTAHQVHTKILPQLKGPNPDLIVIGLGANDAFRLSSPKKWKQEVSAVIKGLQERFGHCPIIFTNMPPIKEFPAFTPLIKTVVGNLVELLGQELEKLVKRFDQVYYEGKRITLKDWKVRFPDKASKGEFFSDGIHPSKLTYQIWAKDMVAFIMDNPKIARLFKDESYRQC
ncbi:SGNH/GDSL hydrolase family protein [Pararhodonellum marinum]|uniref:SGNH/GDSL hydrolase family protein n=1 Tax=Pararhodonellum marinum TaxID=2755358 RepID=UPI00188DF29C|nr:SGNH/GDSL hydrolase family protein [Pararhodonellum marinum]